MLAGHRRHHSHWHAVHAHSERVIWGENCTGRSVHLLLLESATAVSVCDHVVGLHETVIEINRVDQVAAQLRELSVLPVDALQFGIDQWPHLMDNALESQHFVAILRGISWISLVQQEKQSIDGFLVNFDILFGLLLVSFKLDIFLAGFCFFGHEIFGLHAQIGCDKVCWEIALASLVRSPPPVWVRLLDHHNYLARLEGQFVVFGRLKVVKCANFSKLLSAHGGGSSWRCRIDCRGAAERIHRRIK